MARIYNKSRAEAAMREFLEAVGEDLDDPQMRDTPARYTAMFCEELLAGHNADTKVKTFATEGVGNTFVVMSDLQVNSTCCHHLMPIIGIAHIGAYYSAGVPSSGQDVGFTILPGLSKYQRIVTKYARRLQLQERMTHQIAAEIAEDLKADWVIVQVIAAHHCMIQRGVQSPHAKTTTTSIVSNVPLEQSTRFRSDFFQEIALARKT